MCESEREGRNWRLYVHDMCEFSEKVLSYTEGLDLDAFVDDGLTYDATLRNEEPKITAAHCRASYHAVFANTSVGCSALQFQIGDLILCQFNLGCLDVDLHLFGSTRP